MKYCSSQVVPGGHSYSLTPAAFVTPSWVTQLVDTALVCWLRPLLSMLCSPMEPSHRHSPLFPTEALLQLHCLSWLHKMLEELLCLSPFPLVILWRQLQKHQRLFWCMSCYPVWPFPVRWWSAAGLGCGNSVGILLSGEVGKWLLTSPGRIVTKAGWVPWGIFRCKLFPGRTFNLG